MAPFGPPSEGRRRHRGGRPPPPTIQTPAARFSLTPSTLAFFPLVARTLQYRALAGFFAIARYQRQRSASTSRTLLRPRDRPLTPIAPRVLTCTAGLRWNSSWQWRRFATSPNAATALLDSAPGAHCFCLPCLPHALVAEWAMLRALWRRNTTMSSSSCSSATPVSESHASCCALPMTPTQRATSRRLAWTSYATATPPFAPRLSLFWGASPSGRAPLPCAAPSRPRVLLCAACAL
jgi:hypothetical protein